MSTNANTAVAKAQAVETPTAKVMGATVDSWSGNRGGQYKRDMVGAASHGGYCYLRLLFYFNWFDSEIDNDSNAFDSLEFYLMCLKDRLGPEPEGLKVLTELAVAAHNYLNGKPLYFDIEEGMVGVTSVAAIFDMMKESKARVDFDQIDGVIHLKGNPTFCECEGPVCLHGWTYVYQDDETRQRENEHVRKLRPINGLPKPFLSSRLNFLANFHTGLVRCLSKRPDEPVRCLFSFMRTAPLIPVDDLLHQVLSVSVDRHEFVYASNPFKLPYIEVGMLVTEESIAKMLDLLTGEYKGLWFQEMKGLAVPDFHNEFLNKSHDPVERQFRRSRDEGKQISHRPPPQRQGKRSILGF